MRDPDKEKIITSLQEELAQNDKLFQVAPEELSGAARIMEEEIDKACGKVQEAPDDLIQRIASKVVSRIITERKEDARDPDADFIKKDVLIGPVKSEKQYGHCLEKRYYYVPARFVPDDLLPIRYVAMALPKSSSEPGIRYYGEVIRVSKQKRRIIPFPMSRRNGDEVYYAFVVREWIALPKPISPQEESVYKPLFTTLFLLRNAEQIYELSRIGSSESYTLHTALKALCGASPEQCPRYGVGPHLALVRTGEHIELTDESGAVLTRCAAADFVNSPKRIFLQFRNTAGLL